MHEEMEAAKRDAMGLPPEEVAQGGAGEARRSDEARHSSTVNAPPKDEWDQVR